MSMKKTVLTILATIALPLFAQAEHEVSASVCSLQIKNVKNPIPASTVLLYSLKLDGVSKPYYQMLDLSKGLDFKYDNSPDSAYGQSSAMKWVKMPFRSAIYQHAGDYETDSYSFDGTRVMATLQREVTPKETIEVGQIADSSGPVNVSWESLEVDPIDTSLTKNFDLTCQPLKLNRDAFDIGAYQIKTEVRGERATCGALDCGETSLEKKNHPFIRLMWSVLPNTTLNGKRFKLYEKDNAYSVFSWKFWAAPKGDEQRYCTLRFGKAQCEESSRR